jgi:hypothetical protein
LFTFSPSKIVTEKRKAKSDGEDEKERPVKASRKK